MRRKAGALPVIANQSTQPRLYNLFNSFNSFSQTFIHFEFWSVQCLKFMKLVGSFFEGEIGKVGG